VPGCYVSYNPYPEVVRLENRGRNQGEYLTILAPGGKEEERKETYKLRSKGKVNNPAKRLTGSHKATRGS